MEFGIEKKELTPTLLSSHRYIVLIQFTLSKVMSHSPHVSCIVLMGDILIKLQ